MRETMEFKGYIRENGMVASRNHVAILPSVVCANDVALGIANQVMNTRALPRVRLPRPADSSRAICFCSGSLSVPAWMVSISLAPSPSSGSSFS